MSADVSARLAWPDDAADIAGLQRAAWAEVAEADELPPLEALEASWRDLLVRPPEARVRTLVALEHATVRGLALVHPSTDPDADPVADGEVGELVVDPRHRRAGHGSRLLQAAVDTLQADGFRRASWWLAAGDDALRSFVVASGWAADGAHRELEAADGARLKQVRLHTSLVDG